MQINYAEVYNVIKPYYMVGPYIVYKTHYSSTVGQRASRVTSH